jgi:hypothetical protein
MIRRFLDEWAVKALPKSPLGEAVAYARSQWPTLTAYVQDGRLRIDDDEVELPRSAGSPWAGRTTSSWARSRAATSAATFYLLIESCKSAGVEPFEYLCDVLGRVARSGRRERTAHDDSGAMEGRAGRSADGRPGACAGCGPPGAPPDSPPESPPGPGAEIRTTLTRSPPRITPPRTRFARDTRNAGPRPRR